MPNRTDSSAPKILDGKWLAKQFEQLLKKEVEQLSGMSGGKVPGLAVILVGDNPASEYYVRTKGKVARRCGFKTFDEHLPAGAPFEEVARALEQFNENPAVHGILVQLPLPKQIDEKAILDMIVPTKDADGLHPLNQGLLDRGDGWLRPCTPVGCLHLVDLACSDQAVGGENTLSEPLPKVDLSGKSAVVVGRSLLVGKPVAQLLLERNATVTLAHSRTADLPAVCRTADVLVAAVGRPQMISKEYVKPGAVVIDVGINRLDSGKLTGDVDFENVAPNCAAITPVPGGVGPMTVAMLMQNTFAAFKRSLGRE